LLLGSPDETALVSHYMLKHQVSMGISVGCCGSLTAGGRQLAKTLIAGKP